jgi:hypothetical protein
MKQTIGFSEFQDAFTNLRPQNFSLQGLGALWDYFEQYEEDTGQEVELDVIAICCDYSEDSAENIAAAYDVNLSECKDEEEQYEAVKEYLHDMAVYVGEVSGGFVYRNF